MSAHSKPTPQEVVRKEVLNLARQTCLFPGMSEVEIDRVLEALQALLLATGKTSWTEAELRALLLLAKQVLQPTLPKGRRGRPKQKAPAGQNVPELVKQASEKLGGLKPLARELGVDPNTIRRYRNGRNPEESVVKKLRDLLS